VTKTRQHAYLHICRKACVAPFRLVVLHQR
jgi:hypothetical protein